MGAITSLVGAVLSRALTATSNTTLAAALTPGWNLNVGTYSFKAVLNFSEATAGTGGIKFAIAGNTATINGTNTPTTVIFV
jgi:hypothetical protein